MDDDSSVNCEQVKNLTIGLGASINEDELDIVISKVNSINEVNGCTGKERYSPENIMESVRIPCKTERKDHRSTSTECLDGSECQRSLQNGYNGCHPGPCSGISFLPKNQSPDQIIGNCTNQRAAPKSCDDSVQSTESQSPDVIPVYNEDDFQCSLCCSLFCDQNHLDTHILSKHSLTFSRHEYSMKSESENSSCSSASLSVAPLSGVFKQPEAKYSASKLEYSIQTLEGNDLADLSDAKDFHREGRSRCHICFICVRKDRMLSHMNGHSSTEAKMIRCLGCNWGSTKRDHLVNHMNICKLFEKKCSSSIHTDFIPCPVCLSNVGARNYIINHIRNIHLLSEKPADTNHFCPGCNGHFRDKAGLTEHMNICVVLFMKNDVKSVHACGICHIPFSRSEQLVPHQKRFHILTDLENLRCCVCDERAALLEDLVEHAAKCLFIRSLLSDRTSASKDKPAKRSTKAKEMIGCKSNVINASKEFSRNTLLHSSASNELLFPFGTKQYSCESCGRVCLNLKGLKSHMRKCLSSQQTGISNMGPIATTKESLATESTSPSDIQVSTNAFGEVTLSDVSKASGHVDLQNCLLPNSMLEDKQVQTSTSLCNMNKFYDGNEEVTEWKCLSCRLKFNDETIFLLHVASHEVTNVSCCFICSFSFKTAAEICWHLVTTHRLFLLTGINEGLENEKNDCKESDVDANQVELPTVGKSHGSLIDLEANKDKCNVESSVDGSWSERLPRFHHDKLTGTKCPVCKRTFKSSAILKKHYGIHDGFYLATCLICGIGFCRKSILKAHKVRCHRSSALSTEFSCTRCDGHFENKFSLNRHMELCICQRHFESPRCVMCPRKFDSWAKLIRHSPLHLKCCTFCNKPMESQKKRITHMLSCSQNPLIRREDLPSCSDGLLQTSVETKCSKTDDKKASVFNSTNQLSLEAVKYKCTQCCFLTSHKYNLKKHERLHKGAEYRCRVCGGKFNSLSAVNRHMLREHGSYNKKVKAAKPVIKTTSVAEDRRNDVTVLPRQADPLIIKDTQALENVVVSEKTPACFPCLTCGLFFDTKQKKDCHDQAKHNGLIKVFVCKVCGKRFPSKFAKRRHMQKFHSSTNNLHPICSICSKLFPSNFARLQHLKKYHSNASSEISDAKKTKRCNFCDRTFIHKRDLRSHVKDKHSDVEASREPQFYEVSSPNPKTCQVCHATFDHRSRLRAHFQAVHTDDQNQKMPTMDTKAINGEAISSIKPSSAELREGGGEKHVTSSEKSLNQSTKRSLWQCNSCGQLFGEKTHLKHHKAAQHSSLSPTANQSLLPSCNGSSKKDEFMCKVCTKSFKLRMALVQHVNKAHPHHRSEILEKRQCSTESST